MPNVLARLNYRRNRAVAGSSIGLPHDAAPSELHGLGQQAATVPWDYSRLGAVLSTRHLALVGQLIEVQAGRANSRVWFQLTQVRLAVTFEISPSAPAQDGCKLASLGVERRRRASREP